LRPSKSSVCGRSAPRVAAAALLAALALAPGLARAAAVLDNFRQRSHAGASSLSLGFTVGSGADRLLLVGVTTARSDAAVTEVSFRGIAGIRILALPITQGGRSCRTELWRIVDPPSGNGQVAVSLSATTAMGMGMVSYTGVDQDSPIGGLTSAAGTTSPARVSVSAGSARPIVGVACLGGAWPMLMGPDALAASGETNLWDFTETNVVGLGNHQELPAAGSTSISWNIIFPDPFSWGAIGVSITPAAPAPPPADAGPDLAPDVRVPEDLFVPADLAPPEPDAAEVVIDPAADASDPLPDLPAAPDTEGAPADARSAGEPDADDTTRDVNLRIGCACRVGGGERGGSFLLALALLALSIRRRLI
jgi:MYXO-CTERM domain-containing protein